VFELLKFIKSHKKHWLLTLPSMPMRTGPIDTKP
jgi:hypothetical protein